VFVKGRRRLVAIPIAQVQRLEACDDYVALHVEGRQFLLYARLYDLFARLDQNRFIRVHRSHVVNIAFITALEQREGSRFTVVLSNGDRVPASRTGSAELNRLRLA
jgi:two-component system LytT family response regulator